MYWGWGFWGMSVFWWLFWVAAIFIFFAWMTPVPRSRAQQMRETPLDILRRRYAAGELTTEEFEERRQRLEGDRSGAPDKSPPRPPAPPPDRPVAH